MFVPVLLARLVNLRSQAALIQRVVRTARDMAVLCPRPIRSRLLVPSCASKADAVALYLLVLVPALLFGWLSVALLDLLTDRLRI